MADISLQSATEIAITDTTLIPAQPTGGVWSKITGLGIKTYLQSLFDAKVSTTGNETIAGIKTFSSSPIVPTPTTGTQASNKDYSDALNPDFYQYSIVRTVASGNLTVALKNYEGNDPTPTKPVKIMIGGVVRSVTSALSVTQISGGAAFNAGSAELATKEIDYFTYLFYYSNKSGGAKVGIGFARVPSFNTISETGLGVPSSEKFFQFDWDWVNNPPGTESLVNIGRFNATLSAGAGYTWSIPATSVIVNKPTLLSRSIDLVPQLSTGTSMTFTSTSISLAKYSLVGNHVTCSYTFNGTTGGTLNRTVKATMPFSAANGANIYRGIGMYEDPGALATPCEWYIDGTGVLNFRPTALANYTAGGHTFYLTLTYDI